MLSNLDNKFNPSRSGGDFGVFDQWLQVSMARFTKVLLVAGENIEWKAKEKATVTSNSNTGDDKEKASCPSLLSAIFVVAVSWKWNCTFSLSFV